MRLELKHYAVLIIFGSAKIKVQLRAKSEATKASLPMLSSAKLALAGGAKALASPIEANTTGEVVLKSPIV